MEAETADEGVMRCQPSDASAAPSLETLLHERRAILKAPPGSDTVSPLFQAFQHSDPRKDCFSGKRLPPSPERLKREPRRSLLSLSRFRVVKRAR